MELAGYCRLVRAILAVPSCQVPLEVAITTGVLGHPGGALVKPVGHPVGRWRAGHDCILMLTLMTSKAASLQELLPLW